VVLLGLLKRIKGRWACLALAHRFYLPKKMIASKSANMNILGKATSGFKEIKQDIGSSKSQTRNAYAVLNHINFSMMATTVTWIYGARLEKIP
jgi:hypothetical protein